MKNDSANPTHSFKDRVVTVAAAARAGARLHRRSPAPRRATSPTRRGAPARRSAWRPTCSSRPTSRSRRSSPRASTGRTSSRSAATTTTSTASAPSSRGERDWAFVNVNMRPYYAEGSKTLAYEIAEQLGWRTPDRVVAPIASGSLYTKIAKGFHEFCELGLDRGRPAAHERRPGDGLLPGRDRVRRGPDFCRPVRPTGIAKSLAIGIAGRRAVRARRSRARAAAASTRSTTTRSAPGSGCWPRRPASSPRPPAA